MAYWRNELSFSRAIEAQQILYSKNFSIDLRKRLPEGVDLYIENQDIFSETNFCNALSRKIVDPALINLIANGKI